MDDQRTNKAGVRSKNIPKATALAAMSFVGGSLAAEYLMGASREHAIHTLAFGLPIAVITFVLTLLIAKYFRLTT